MFFTWQINNLKQPSIALNDLIRWNVMHTIVYRLENVHKSMGGTGLQ